MAERTIKIVAIKDMLQEDRLNTTLQTKLLINTNSRLW